MWLSKQWKKAGFLLSLCIVIQKSTIKTFIEEMLGVEGEKLTIPKKDSHVGFVKKDKQPEHV